VVAKLLEEKGCENVTMVKGMPYDLLALKNGKIIKIEVKSLSKSKAKWSFNAKKFLEIELNEAEGVQEIIKNKFNES